MNSLGTQHIAEFIGCNDGLMEEAPVLEAKIIACLEQSGLHMVKCFSHHFKPAGLTIVAIISESHFAIHTYPETALVSIDLYTCTQGEKHQQFIACLKSIFKPALVKQAELDRGNPLSIRYKDSILARNEAAFEIRYFYKKLLFTTKSPFQLIEIVEHEEFGRMLFLDKELQISSEDAGLYQKIFLDLVKIDEKKMTKILVLGGGDGVLASALSKSGACSVQVVDIDQLVYESCKVYFPEFFPEEPDISYVFAEALEYLKSSEKYDLIVYDFTMHPEWVSTFSRETYFPLLVQAMNKHLLPGGLLGGRIGSKTGSLSKDLASMIKSNGFGILKDQVHFLPSFGQEYRFMLAGKLH